jgi:hypothetical protein
MQHSGASNAIVAAVLIVGILIGVTGYYVATTYQTKILTQTETTTTSLTSIETQTLVLTSTQINVVTTTSVSSITSTSTVSVYPVPDNLTLVFADSSGGYTYNIQPGNQTISGTTSGTDVFHITELFQGEMVTVEVATGSALPENGFSCGGGNYVTMQMYFNGQLVAHASKSCTGSGYAVMTYVV